jgi:uncharacterized metal-binding protein YceD (DUF177 family)
MINIYIHGLKNGLYDIDLTVPVKEVKDMYPEFFGDIEVKGKLRIINRRYSFSGTAECQAKLICDISLTEFVENITTDINASFLADTNMFLQSNNEESDDNREHVIHEDDKYIDISLEVREELAVHLPMKKIAPEYRDKKFEEIFPEYSAEGKKKKKAKSDEIDDRWAALKNLKIN